MKNRFLKIIIFILFIIHIVAALSFAGNFSDVLTYMQWGLKNTGQIIIRREGQLKREQVIGIPGTDINWVSIKELAPKNSKDVIVAVLDTGIDVFAEKEFKKQYDLEGESDPNTSSSNNDTIEISTDLDTIFSTHPDLDGKIWVDQACVKKIIDKLSKNKKIPEGLSESALMSRVEPYCYGLNFLESNADISDETSVDGAGHGTFVSGIIAGKNDDYGIAGVLDDKVKIMPIKIVNARLVEESKSKQTFAYKPAKADNPVLYTKILANAIIYAVKQGADVINLSLGWPEMIQYKVISDALDFALNNNVPLVVAASNNNKDAPSYPCTYPGVICVGSVDNRGKITEFSDFGGKIDILAPGEQIVSTFPRLGESRRLRINGFESKQGNSFATPFVTAIVAGLKILYPNITIDEIKARIYGTARPAEDAMWGEKYSLYGLINMKEALLNKPEYFISPIFKRILNIEYDPKTLEFKIDLPIKNYLKKLENITVEIKIDSNNIQLANNSFNIASLESGKTKNLNITGKILKTNAESHTKLSVKIYISDKLVSSKATPIDFYYDSTKSDFIKIANTRINNLEINPKTNKAEARFFLTNGLWNLLTLYPVSNKNYLSKYPEYFAVENSKQTDEKTLITLLTIKDLNITTNYIKIPRVEDVLGIFRADINLDGSPDYVIYTKIYQNLIDRTLKIGLNFFKNDFTPLFEDKSNWIFQADMFGGLPRSGVTEEFAWVKHSTEQFGQILVPCFIKNWEVADADNSENQLDRLMVGTHILYFNPILKDKFTYSPSIVFVSSLVKPYNL